MKIFFSTSPMCFGRIKPFIDHLKCLEYNVVVDENIENETKDDIWFIDFVRISDKDIVNFFSENENKILGFKGKICLYSLDDGGYTHSTLISKNVLNRVSGWLTGIKHKRGTLFGNETIYDKLILFPWFVIPPRSLVDIEKENNIIFFGHPTGGKNLYSSQIVNPRTYAIRKLRNNEKLSGCFMGGIVVHETFNQEIPEEISDITVPYLSNDKIFELYDKNLVSLCLPGNKRWTYRHLESMRSKCAIISFPLNSVYEGEWLYQDKFENELYYINEDMSNLEEICQKSLSNIWETKEMALCSNNIYKNFFEINGDMSFKLPVWFEIKEEFEKRGIIFNRKNEYKNVSNLYGDWWGEPADIKRGGWWGWGHDLFFKELIEKENIKTVCEVGTYMGKSSHFFAKMLPSDGKVTTIDTFKGSPEHYAKKLFVQLNEMYHNAVVNLKLGEFEKKIQIINRKSCDVNLNGEVFDLVYIDGPHDMHTVINDIIKYRNSIKTNGILSGDDYLWPEVKKGVDYCVNHGIIPPLLGVYRETIWYCRIK